jgi:hypothetical protein
MTLCEQPSKEKDPQKLQELVKEINRLLKEKRPRLAKEELDSRYLPPIPDIQVEFVDSERLQVISL